MPRNQATRWMIAAVVAAVVVGVGAILWFEPQKLFMDNTVDEAAPVAAAASPTAPSSPSTMAEQTTTTLPPGPQVVSVGEFSDVDHEGTGVAQVIRNADGTQLVRFEDLAVSNGPDLVVILSRAPVGSAAGAYDDGDYVVLGELKANKGNQNYDVPPGVDLSSFNSVAVWCRRFNSTFNVAPVVVAPAV